MEKPIEVGVPPKKVASVTRKIVNLINETNNSIFKFEMIGLENTYLDY